MVTGPSRRLLMTVVIWKDILSCEIMTHLWSNNNSAEIDEMKDKRKRVEIQASIKSMKRNFKNYLIS